jgi:outer membrane protein insertion porin family
VNHKLSLIVICIVFALAPFFLSSADAQEIRKIAIFPFEVHSRTHAPLLQEALSKGLTAELLKSKNIEVVERNAIAEVTAGRKMNEALALSAGRILAADLVVTGSITELGELISVDAKVVDVKQGKTISGIIVQGRGLKSIESIQAQLKREILSRAYVDLTVARVEFMGNLKIEATAIQQVLKSVKGTLYSEADVTADIRAIYKMGYFDDVSADVTDSPKGKIITFRVVEKALISEIKIQGNKAMNIGDIHGALTTKPRQVVNSDKINTDIEKIRELYHAKGYYNAEISNVLEKRGDKEVVVLFNIVENDKLYVSRISFEGNRTFSDKELRNIMKTTEWGILHFFTDSGVLKKDELKQDISKLNAFYLNNGFINAQVGEPEITHDKKGIYLKIPVVEGKQFKVGKVEITGDTLKVSRDTLRKNLSISKQEYFSREAMIKDIDYLIQMCNDEGFAYADALFQTTPQEKSQTVDVTYQLKKGNEVYFSRVLITGNSKTRDKVIRRQLSIMEGDLYSKSALKRSYNALAGLRYFEEVDFQTEKGTSESQTDVLIRVKEKQTGMFSVGAGYSALDNAVVTASISQQNLFGRGQILTLKAAIGGSSQNYDLSFIEPWLFDIPLWSKLDLWNYSRQYDTYKLSSNGVGAMLGYGLWEYVTGYLGYRLSEDNVKDIQANASNYIRRQAGVTTTSGLTATLVRNTLDDSMFPSKGSKNSLSVTYTGGFLGGNTSFTKTNALSAWYFPLPLETVFGLYGKAGYLSSNDGKDVPVYERYILGGMSTLRGQRDIGPRDPLTGDLIGGLTWMGFSGEFVFPLIRNAGMKAVLFYDTGNAWNSGYHIDDMRQTAGAGVRWYSPIGPLRLEYGFVLDRKDGESGGRFEFTLGMLL